MFWNRFSPRHRSARSRRSLVSVECGRWPSIVPGKGGNLQKGMSRSRVISVKDDDISILLQRDRFAARSQPALIASQQRASSSLQHRLAALVQIWPGHTWRTTNHGLVGALCSTAAQVEGNEEIVIVAMLNDERSLNGLPVGRQARGRGRSIVGTLPAG